MQNIILTILKSIKAQKEQAGKHPANPLKLELTKELYKRMSEELETMEKAGIITTGHTLNDKYIELNNV